ncbi:MAG TPA: hypothetical protein VL500_04435 [Candidatus Eisenbacteria bacterium]|nr:hypothetical protein [Candidatus Eisenbacteria bacterium]
MRGLLPIIAGLLLPAAALAGANDGAPFTALALLGSLIGVSLAVAGILAILAILIGPFVFWIFMVVDATKRQWPERNMWLIVLWLSLFFGLYLVSALLYYFLVQKKNVGKMPTT